MRVPTCGDLGDGKACEWWNSDSDDGCKFGISGWSTNEVCPPVCALVECRRERDEARENACSKCQHNPCLKCSIPGELRALGEATRRISILTERNRQAQVRIFELEKELKAAEADRDKWRELLAGMRCECGVYPAPCGPCQARREEGE